MSHAALFKISQLAIATGASTETIRYYEQEGLLPQPARSASNYRLYGDEHIKRRQFIRHCRSLDMSLDEIRLLLSLRDVPEASCDGVNTLLDKHIDHVATRIQELQSLRSQLEQLRSQCGETRSARQCGILLELDRSD
ncbi:Cd(II)/Pb(II)-responsive transcriptional regulator [Pseudoduganella sp. UC29_106]|uniref:Cd(II)/Pb(II)-responsive transcriptional regulator n=1 Tax=Pseudoduganella sp. UC29_106 TaxID=3374553 RepID=UPI00375838A5